MKLSATLKEAGRGVPFIKRFQAMEGRLMNTRAEQLYELVDMLSECTIFAHQRREPAPFYLFRLLLFKRRMKRQVDDLDNKLLAIPTHEDGTGESNIPHSYPDFEHPSLIIGFESQAGEIEDLLTPNRRFKAIGILGRCGCGKTALTHKVFVSPTIEAHYSPRIWMPLSDTLLANQRSDPKLTVLTHILKQISSSWHEEGDYSVVKLLEMVQLGLMGKRYLIVLDDAWRMDEWFADLGCRGRPGADSFTHGLPKGSGGAVIVTSRRGSVIRGMVGEEEEEEYVIRPQLSDEACWKIFSDALKINANLIDTEMKASITNKCEGLPLAAKTLATLIPKLLAGVGEGQAL